MAEYISKEEVERQFVRWTKEINHLDGYDMVLVSDVESFLDDLPYEEKPVTNQWRTFSVY